MGFISSYTPTGMSQEEAEALKKEVVSLKEQINSGNIRLEALISLGLEKENITQDRFDELMELLKSFGKQKGLKVD